MSGFEAHKRRYQFSASKSRRQFNAQKRARATFDVVAPSKVQTSTGPTTIEDFEDGDLSEYLYSTGSFSIQSTVVKEGANALRVDVGDNEHISSFPGDGLPYYPKAGDTFRFWSRTSNMDRWILLYFGCQEGTGGPDDRPDGYAAFLSFGRSEIRFRKRESDINSLLTSTAYDFTADTWYDTEVEWGTDGTITIRLFNEAGTQLASVSATDTTFTSGGITWQTSGVQGPKYVDHARRVA